MVNESTSGGAPSHEPIRKTAASKRGLGMKPKRGIERSKRRIKRY